MKKKKLRIISVITAIAVTVMLMPDVAFAAISSGYIDSYRDNTSGHPQHKYQYINGANVSLNWLETNLPGQGVVGNNAEYAYPFGVGNFPGSGDTPYGTTVSQIGWDTGSIGTYASTCAVKIGGSWQNFGTLYTVPNLTNQKAETALAFCLVYGFPESSNYASYGLDYTHGMYATNVQIQNLAALFKNGGNETLNSYDPDSTGRDGSSLAKNQATAAYTYDLGQQARKYLVNSDPHPLVITKLSGAPSGNNYVAQYMISTPVMVAGVPWTSFYRSNYIITNVFPSGTIISGYTGQLDASGQQTITITVPLSGNAGKTYTSTATNDYINYIGHANIYLPKYGSNTYTRRLAADDQVYINTTDVYPTTTFSLTIPNKPDLVVSNITTDKDTYAGNDPVTITATVKNIGSVSAGASQAQVSATNLTAVDFGNKSVPALAAGASANVTWTAKAPIFSSNTTATITATADATSAVDEVSESNNTASKSVTIVAAMPDLTISSLKTDKSNYEAGDTVTVTAVAVNNGYTDVPSTSMKLDISSAGTHSKSVSILTANGGTQTATFTFIAPTSQTEQTLTLTATVDPDNTVAESNESNNTLTSTCTVGALKPDVTITNTTVQNWYAGKDIVVSAMVKNLTAQPVPSVTVRFTMGGIVMDTSVPIAGNGSNLAVFRFTVPHAGTYPVSFTADPSGVLGETNKSNNTWNGQVTVVDVPASTVFDPDDTGMEQQYRVYGLKPMPTTSNSNYHTWQEERLENGNYVTKDFWAKLTTTFTVSSDSRITLAGQPDVMESGFGVQAQCITTLTSNYDHPEDLIGPQMVWALNPESGYGQTENWQNVRDSMETASGQAGAWSITWQYAVNPYSSIGARLHYIPIWFPDSQYTARAQAFYAWSPVGQLYDYTTDGVTISGDMYDRITTVGR